MKLQNEASAVDQRYGAPEVIVGANNRWFDPSFTQCIFKQPVEIRRNDDPDKALTHQPSYRAMSLGRALFRPSLMSSSVGSM